MTTIEQIMELVIAFKDSQIPVNSQSYSESELAIKSAITELAADAARYEWLAKYLPSSDETHDDAIISCENKEQIDAAIDAAMKGTP